MMIEHDIIFNENTCMYLCIKLTLVQTLAKLKKFKKVPVIKKKGHYHIFLMRFYIYVENINIKYM